MYFNHPILLLLQSFVNPEDVILNKAPEVVFNDPDVERVRR